MYYMYHHRYRFDPEIIEFLLTYMVSNINEIDFRGFLPIHYAVNTLLNQDEMPNCPDLKNPTPVELANALNWFVKNGAALNSFTKQKMSVVSILLRNTRLGGPDWKLPVEVAVLHNFNLNLLKYEEFKETKDVVTKALIKHDIIHFNCAGLTIRRAWRRSLAIKKAQSMMRQLYAEISVYIKSDGSHK